MESEILPEALEQMRSQGGSWAAYRNHALDNSTCGDLRFLKYGKGCTFEEPPNRYPDSHLGTGWRYILVGTVDLEKGCTV